MREVETASPSSGSFGRAIGLMPAYESYAGQPFAEFTARSCADRRDWLIGTPDDAIAWIEQKQAESGGFGGLMLTTHEWADSNLLRHSMEMFARYVMPHFRGHNATYQDEWRRIREARDAGGLTLNVTGRPNNLKSF